MQALTRGGTLTCAQEPDVQRQRGVLRTNCIDCLDRTNVAQFAAGLAGLGRQLAGLGLAARADLDPRSSAAQQLMAMYETMGNTLARQVRARGLVMLLTGSAPGVVTPALHVHGS